VKIREVYNLYEGIKELIDKELPISTAYKIQKNFTKLEDEVKQAEVIRKKIIDKYKEGKEDENGNVDIKEDCVEYFNKEIEELFTQEVELELKKINVEELEGIKIKPLTLSRLDLIIVE